ncbi:MAG: acyl-CoA dehydrogenase [Desulfarculus sp.]|jgi:acyl-CoA dehydrogenase|nr:MAG: acyl-CoA dehydrogenase [Desulfarculus sp.]
MARRWLDQEHEIFREAFRRYVQKEIAPHIAEWDQQGQVPREAWLALGRQGYLCPWLEERYGGSGADFGYSVIIIEEIARAGALSFMVGLHSDIVTPYLHAFANEEQRQRWLPGAASGQSILAIAMTEPDAGSDLQAMRATASKDGEHYLLNGSKTFISNGQCCDLVIVAAKTDLQADPARGGISLLVVEEGAPGFVKGNKLKKMGLHGQDTCEMVFSDCRVPAANLLGREGRGFAYMMEKLQQERLVCAVMSQAAAEAMLRWTVDYCQERRIFGRPVGQFQHNAFKLAEMATEVELGRAFLDELIEDHMAGRDIVSKVSMAKWWISEMANRVAYHGVQLHGGYGYMEEYPICRAYRDVRVHTIFAGTTEVMKSIIAKRMGL